ncbi:MAG: hypothetical protein ACK4S4_07975 [Pyrinomonadaceae bacterium]
MKSLSLADHASEETANGSGARRDPRIEYPSTVSLDPGVGVDRSLGLDDHSAERIAQRAAGADDRSDVGFASPIPSSNAAAIDARRTGRMLTADHDGGGLAR